jgi:hypothetical protein
MFDLAVAGRVHTLLVACQWRFCSQRVVQPYVQQATVLKGSVASHPRLEFTLGQLHYVRKAVENCVYSVSYRDSMNLRYG